MIIVSCFKCKKDLSIHNYRLKRTSKFFCSFKCREGTPVGSKKTPKLCQYCNQKEVRQRAGRDVRYCSRICNGLAKRNQFIIKKGYKRILKWGHPRTDSKGYVREHILVMEEKIGRHMKPGEVVHHIDENKLNNHPDNLVLFKNHNEHMRHHRKIKGT